ncbi:hypothetical protein DYH55_11075 [Methylovirgula sp. 4M-Z18]|nr:hypothetical protein DYH55_11075 [Methylovirgula sp. 4M-Z18]
MSATPAAAWWRHGGWGWGGPAIAAGVLGGLVVGSAIANSRPYYGPGPGYYYDGPCHPARTPVYDGYGNFAGYRVVRVCE